MKKILKINFANFLLIILIFNAFITSLSLERANAKPKTLYEKIAEQSVMDNIKSTYVTNSTGIDFSKPSSDTNGKGVYTIANTINNKYPIHYYRGDVNNNYISFAGYCWKAVITTETGGTKIIYNGKANEDGTCSNELDYEDGLEFHSYHWDRDETPYTLTAGYMFNSNKNYEIDSTYYTSNGWIKKLNLKESKQNMVEPDQNNYYFSKSVKYENNKYKLENPHQYTWKYYDDDYNSSLNDELLGQYTCLQTSNNDTCDKIYYITNTSNGSTGEWYNNYINYVEFEQGNTYDSLMNNSSYNITVGKDVEYKDGKYKLVDTTTISTIKIQSPEYANENSKVTSGSYHYTCNNSSIECEEVNYIYSINESSYGSNYYYFKLNNGTEIEDLPPNMSINNKDSIQKDLIDKWYKNNLSDYATYIEDTVYCNARQASQNSIYNKNFFSYITESNYNYYIYNTKAYDDYRSNSNPNITCPNKNDAFTVDSEIGNGKLTYPIALLTLDETSYAGIAYENLNDYYNDFRILVDHDKDKPKNYLGTEPSINDDEYSDDYEFYPPYNSIILTPAELNIDDGTPLLLSRNGSIIVASDMCSESLESDCGSFGLRPVVSLKNDTTCAGEGTIDDPCVIGKTEEETPSEIIPTPILPPNTADGIVISVSIIVVTSIITLYLYRNKKKVKQYKI